MTTLIQTRQLKWNAPAGQKVILHLGMGLDSISILCAMHQLGVKPDLIIFADTGAERPETYQYRDEVLMPWLASVGFPAITQVRRMDEIKVKRRETLLDEVQRTRTLPSVAYGFHKCSLKFKIDPINAFLRKRCDWTKAEWAAGRKVTKVIGYNVDEPRRAKPTFPGKEGQQFDAYYPLFAWGLNREDEAQIVRDSGLPVPGKSACFFCPHATDAEWLQLREQHVDLWEICLEIEAQANMDDNPHKIQKTDDVGLRRRGKRGERQLRDFAAKLDAEAAPCGSGCPGLDAEGTEEFDLYAAATA